MMRVPFIVYDEDDDDFTASRDDAVTALHSAWPDFQVQPDDVRASQLGELSSPVPPALAADIRSGVQVNRWGNRATILAHDGKRRNVTCLFDPKLAVEE